MTYDPLEELEKLANYQDEYMGLKEEDLLEKSWLTEDPITVCYVCTKCSEEHFINISGRVPDSKYRNHQMLCNCEKETLFPCKFARVEPRKLGIMTKIQFEKNGRIGLKTKFANGKTTTRSMTKENVMNGKGTDSVLTKSCLEHTRKEQHKMVNKQYNQMKSDIERQRAARRKK